MSTPKPSPGPGTSCDRPPVAAHVAHGTDARSATALAAGARRRGAKRRQLAILLTTSDPVAYRRAILALRALTP